MRLLMWIHKHTYICMYASVCWFVFMESGIYCVSFYYDCYDNETYKNCNEKIYPATMQKQSAKSCVLIECQSLYSCWFIWRLLR